MPRTKPKARAHGSIVLILMYLFYQRWPRRRAVGRFSALGDVISITACVNSRVAWLFVVLPGEKIGAQAVPVLQRISCFTS
jgi:hypothetical protein